MGEEEEAILEFDADLDAGVGRRGGEVAVGGVGGALGCGGGGSVEDFVAAWAPEFEGHRGRGFGDGGEPDGDGVFDAEAGVAGIVVSAKVNGKLVIQKAASKRNEERCRGAQLKFGEKGYSKSANLIRGE